MRDILHGPQDEQAEHLQLYDGRYFAGKNAVSGYDDYQNCKGVLDRWASMVEQLVHPTSLLDVGCAYGFMLDYFRARNVPAWGMDPSAFAVSHASPSAQPYIARAALPGIPDKIAPTAPVTFDVVTCTEVLEHVPEGLVPASLRELAACTDRFLVTLIMLEGPGADGDEGHICLKSRDWWNAQFDTHTSLVARPDLEATLDQDPYSRNMYWSTRFFVRERVE